MMCFAKSVLTEDLYIVLKEEFSNTFYMYGIHTLQRRSLFIRDKPILSSERLLHENYDPKGSVTKKTSGREPQGDWRQDELIGGKLSVVK
jgi:hypothetical protein